MMYDPRHTTGVSPVHKDVKHPLINDPRRNAGRYQLHKTPGRGRSILGLVIFLVILLAVLAVGLVWLINAASDSAT